MHPIFVDLREDLAGAAREAVMLDAVRERVAGAFPHADVVDRWIMVNAIASGIEKVYSGVERALTRVVRWADRNGTPTCCGVYRSTFRVGARQ